MRTIFTSGQMAEVLGVSIDTIWKWIRSGELRTYRIPGSGDRRIPKCKLEEFAAERGLPFPTDDQPLAERAGRPQPRKTPKSVKRPRYRQISLL